MSTYLRQTGQRWRNRSIGTKMMVNFAILFTVMMLSIGSFTYNLFVGAFERQTIQNTQKVITQAMINIDFYFNDIKTPLIMLARNPNVLKLLRDYSSVDWTSRLSMLRDFEDFTINIYQFKPYIKDMIVIGKNGFVKNVSSSDTISGSYSFFDEAWMSGMKERDLPGIQFISTHASDYYIGKNAQDKVLSALLSVVDNGKVLGYVLCDINLQKFSEIAQTVSVGSASQIYMVDQNGEIIVHSDPAAVGGRIGDSLRQRMSGAGSGYFQAQRDGGDRLIVFNRSQVTGWTLVGEIPYAQIEQTANQNRKAIWVTLIVGILLVIVISYVVSKQITKPIKALLSRIRNVQKHDFNAQPTDYGYGEVAIIGERFERMVKEIHELIEQVYVSNLKQKEAELKELQQQINPHFLYNTLHLIKAEAVMERHREVSSLVTSLGELLRYPITGRNEPVKLEDELAYVRKYVEIYQKRFKGKYEFACEAEEAVREAAVPKFILQPIVENCIVHAFPDRKTDCRIVLRAVCREGIVELSVTDNGVGMAREQVEKLNERILDGDEERSIGLQNVAQRIKLRYGREFGLTVRSEPQAFTEVRLTFPCEPYAPGDFRSIRGLPHA
ncbi:cache domain-containing sensor histidine kinase [Cohnella cellulosilytica]|uniref:Sensor histidine kinase n=1 Tax=Cohnella cellulosilytica TaxID=986710 RepID=A0ABW2F5F9_9BACL